MSLYQVDKLLFALFNDLELQEKYKGWFCWFLQRKIDALASHKTL